MPWYSRLEWEGGAGLCWGVATSSVNWPVDASAFSSDSNRCSGLRSRPLNEGRSAEPASLSADITDEGRSADVVLDVEVGLHVS